MIKLSVNYSKFTRQSYILFYFILVIQGLSYFPFWPNDHAVILNQKHCLINLARAKHKQSLALENFQFEKWWVIGAYTNNLKGNVLWKIRGNNSVKLLT